MRVHNDNQHDSHQPFAIMAAEAKDYTESTVRVLVWEFQKQPFHQTTLSSSAACRSQPLIVSYLILYLIS